MNAKRYSVDLEQGLITFTADQDLGDVRTLSLDSAVEALDWLLRHENELRHMIYRQQPTTIYRPFQPINGFMYGVIEDEQTRRPRPVKVLKTVFDDFLRTQERIIRENWAFDTNHARNDGKPVQFVQYDREGKEVPPLFNPHVTPEDCPSDIIYEHLARFRKPEYWLNRPENLDAGKLLKLP